MMQTPVLFLIFNRPEQSLEVFQQIRLQKPEQLFIAADGPRLDRQGETALCETTRQKVLEQIDWPCQVQTLFQTRNLGCGKAVSTAINWFFDQVEEGIILEDDCIPDPTFFSFCAALLKKYRHDEHILHINGSNFQLGNQRGSGSYYFSRYTHVWGWASWRRAWNKYDFTLLSFQHHSRKGLNTFLQSELQQIYEGTTDTWDIQWFMTIWFNQGKVITPNINLVRNIGYGKGATHTHTVPGWFKKVKYGAIHHIIHPVENNIDELADNYSANTLYGTNSFTIKLKKIVKKNAFLYNLCKRIALSTN